MGSKGRKNVKKPKAAKAKGKAVPETKKKQNGENSKHEYLKLMLSLRGDEGDVAISIFGLSRRQRLLRLPTAVGMVSQ